MLPVDLAGPVVRRAAVRFVTMVHVPPDASGSSVSSRIPRPRLSSCTTIPLLELALDSRREAWSARQRFAHTFQLHPLARRHRGARRARVASVAAGTMFDQHTLTIGFAASPFTS